MSEHYKQSCELILKYKDHREPLIRRTVITLIPAMATYEPNKFPELFLHRSMAHLQGQLSKPGERDAGMLYHEEKELYANGKRDRQQHSWPLDTWLSTWEVR